jgi:hypothetical protein
MKVGVENNTAVAPSRIVALPSWLSICSTYPAMRLNVLCATPNNATATQPPALTSWCEANRDKIFRDRYRNGSATALASPAEAANTHVARFVIHAEIATRPATGLLVRQNVQPAVIQGVTSQNRAKSRSQNSQRTAASEFERWRDTLTEWSCQRQTDPSKQPATQQTVSKQTAKS